MSLGEIQQVSEGIYAYLQPDGSWYLNNTGFLVSRDGVISVDATSTERRTRAYLDAIATVTPKPVRTLVNTHHHGDHTHGNYLFERGHHRRPRAVPGGDPRHAHAPAARRLDRRGLGAPGARAAVPDLHRRRHAVVR